MRSLGIDFGWRDGSLHVPNLRLNLLWPLLLGAVRSRAALHIGSRLPPINGATASSYRFRLQHVTH